MPKLEISVIKEKKTYVINYFTNNATGKKRNCKWKCYNESYWKKNIFFSFNKFFLRLFVVLVFLLEFIQLLLLYFLVKYSVQRINFQKLSKNRVIKSGNYCFDKIDYV